MSTLVLIEPSLKQSKPHINHFLIRPVISLRKLENAAQFTRCGCHWHFLSSVLHLGDRSRDSQWTTGTLHHYYCQMNTVK